MFSRRASSASGSGAIGCAEPKQVALPQRCDGPGGGGRGGRLGSLVPLSCVALRMNLSTQAKCMYVGVQTEPGLDNNHHSVRFVFCCSLLGVSFSGVFTASVAPRNRGLNRQCNRSVILPINVQHSSICRCSHCGFGLGLGLGLYISILFSAFQMQ